jgi:hypothetical protein
MFNVAVADSFAKTIANVNDPLLALDTMGDVTQIEMILMDHLNWQSLLVKLSATAKHVSHMTVTIVLALVTLSGMTKN